MRRKELGFSQTCEYKSNCSTWKCTGYARAVRQENVYQMISKDTRFEVESCQCVLSEFFFCIPLLERHDYLDF